MNEQETPPPWLVRLWRRLSHLTAGRYFAIIEVQKPGVIHTFSLWGAAKVELLDKEQNDKDS